MTIEPPAASRNGGVAAGTGGSAKSTSVSCLVSMTFLPSCISLLAARPHAGVVMVDGLARRVEVLDVDAVAGRRRHDHVLDIHELIGLARRLERQTPLAESAQIDALEDGLDDRLPRRGQIQARQSGHFRRVV